jgi:hypothetical protein
VSNTKPKSWRDQLPIHPAAELLPLMSEPELRELGENIKAQGLKLPVAVCKGQLIDGRNRLDAMELVGIKFEFIRTYAGQILRVSGRNSLVTDIGDRDPYEYVLSVNIHRRHHTPEQKRELIAKVLKAKPEQSNRQIAKQVKADDKTVAKVRRDMESTAEIPQLEKTVGADGKKRKAPKKKRKAATDEERDRKTCVELNQKVLDAERERAQWLADHPAALDTMPSEQEADESWQNDLYDQACLLLERMADSTRQKLFAHIKRKYREAIEEVTSDDQSDQQNTRNEQEQMLLKDGLPEAFIRSRGQ